MSKMILIQRSFISKLLVQISEASSDMDLKLAAWRDLYDERSCNEPEYDSQIDIWQERLDSLEEDADELEEVNGELEEWFDSFGASADGYFDSDRMYYPVEADDKAFLDIVNRYMDINSRRKGLTKYIKQLKDCYVILHTWADRFTEEEVNDMVQKVAADKQNND